MIAEATAMIGELETSLGVPTFAFFANWNGEYAVDADEEAGRLLSSMIVKRLRREGSADQVALILGARGGYPAFADILLRTLRQMDVKIQAVVACRVDGAVGILAAGSDTVTMHPQAGIGALDAGLCVVPRHELDASLLPFWTGESEDLKSSRIAHDRLLRDEQRRMAARLFSAGEEAKSGDVSREGFFESTLGRGTTVAAAELLTAGLAARVAPDPLAEQLEGLLDWADTTLHLFGHPGDRFHASEEWAGEVEFEPASQVQAAAIVGIDSVWIHELDTGRPDPDAPRLLGRWRGWDPEAAHPEKSGEE